MYQTVICLDLPSPAGSSDLPGQCGSKDPPAGRRSVLFGLASDGVYICPARYRAGGGLLHRLCTLTGLPAGGCFLLHLPGSRLHRTLSGILPCEARTFLTCALSGLAAAIVRPAYFFMHFTRESDSCQLTAGSIRRPQIPSKASLWGPPLCPLLQSIQGISEVFSPRNKPAHSASH